MTAFLHELGGITLFYSKVIRKSFGMRRRGEPRQVLAQVTDICWRSLSTVIFAGLFVGAILVLQFNEMLALYDSQTFLGGLNTSACVREVGPLIISFLLAAKIGAFTAAELGTMRVTEQIDAIECLGTDPIEYLVVPRFLGIVISSVVLLLIGLLVSFGGSMVVADLFCGINPLRFAASIPKFLGPWAVVGGMFHSFVYGVIVAGVACFKGFTATGGAKGVGRAVTTSAVYTNLYIVIANFAISHFIETVSVIAEALR